MTKGSWAEIAAGLATLAVLALIFSYATWGRALTEIGGYAVHVTYNRIDGLVVGSKVRLAGVEIGDVTATRLLPSGDRAEVALRIHDGIDIPADSTAAIVSDSMFADKFVRIDPGGDTRMLAAGDRIQYVQDSIDLIGVFQKLVENAEQRLGIDPSKAPQ
jgi:phospholipid/cholesterol/gamma-HCH transport system substrate-binding protein